MPQGKKLATLAIALALVVAGVAIAMLAAPSPGDGQRVVASELAYPRGLSPLDDGRLLVTEVMGGRLLRLSADGSIDVVVEGLPSARGGPARQYPAGASAAVEVNGGYYYIVGEYRGRAASSFYSWHPGGDPALIAGGLGRDGFPASPITNPYDLLPLSDGRFVVSDGGRNAILIVTHSGDVCEAVRFPRMPHPDPEMRSRIDVVPTGMAFGPDGALYVASFTGQPYTPGLATVYRIEGLRQGESVIAESYARGFSFATDVAFLSDGSLLVTEFTTDMLLLIREHGLDGAAGLPGRLVRWRQGEIEVLADNLVTPTSVAVVNDRIFVSEEFAGRVTEVRLDQARLE